MPIFGFEVHFWANFSRISRSINFQVGSVFDVSRPFNISQAIFFLTTFEYPFVFLNRILSSRKLKKLSNTIHKDTMELTRKAGQFTLKSWVKLIQTSWCKSPPWTDILNITFRSSREPSSISSQLVQSLLRDTLIKAPPSWMFKEWYVWDVFVALHKSSM